MVWWQRYPNIMFRDFLSSWLYLSLLLLQLQQRQQTAMAYKDVRAFTVNYNQTGRQTPVTITFDRGIIPIDDAATIVCAQIDCDNHESDSIGLANAVKRLIREQADATIPGIINRYYERTGDDAITRHHWLDLADEKSRRKVDESIREVTSLRYGKIIPRSSCTNNTVRNDRHAGCILTDMFSESKIVELNSGAQQSLDFWWKAAEQMFNSLYYDHAEALAFMIIRAGVNSNLDFADFDFYRHFLMLLTEVCKEKGYTEDGIFFGMHAIDAFTPVSPGKGALQRLRLLLTVPPIPQETIRAIALRGQMMADLRLFLEYIQSSRIVMTLDVR
jgi:hypothetical protein